MKTFILALNHNEAKNFIRKNPNDYIILNRPEQLYGTENPTIKIMPNAYRREDFFDILDAIHIRRGTILR